MWATESEYEDDPVPISGELQEAYSTAQRGRIKDRRGGSSNTNKATGWRAFDPHRRADASGGVSVGYGRGHGDV